MVQLSSIHLNIFGFFVGITFFSSAVGSCLWSITCQCGISNSSLIFCLDVAPRFGDTCRTWAHCATCRNDSNECLSCPEGRSGANCDQRIGFDDENSTSIFPQEGQEEYEIDWSNGDEDVQREIHTEDIQRQNDSNAFTFSCPDLGQVEHANATKGYTKKRGFFPGEKVGYVCRPGYALIGGSPVLTCLDDFRWSYKVPSCLYLYTAPNNTDIAFSCSDPGDVENADMIKLPQVAMFSCHREYDRIGSPTRKCVAPGRWDKKFGRCANPMSTRPGTGKTSSDTGIKWFSECLDPGQVENADRYTEGFPENSLFYTISYTCASGYREIGASDIKCIATDRWSSEKPKCEEVSDDEYEYDEEDYNDDEIVTYCQSPGPIQNGHWVIMSSFNDGGVPPSVEDDEFPERTRLKFFCDPGYTMEGGFPTMHCQTNGFWSRETPFCNPDCGYSSLHSMKRLFRGVNTVPGEWPWTVAISKISGNFSKLSCGGSLLNRRTVLTAAHCLMDPDPENITDFRLYFGKYNRSDERDDEEVAIRTPSLFMIHPRYNDESKNNDIALIRFEPDIQYSNRIRPLCLPTKLTTEENLKPYRSGYVVGWGTTEKNLESEELLMALVPVIPGPDCKIEFDKQNISMPITRNMFCAGFAEGRVASCTGDSGGPLVFHDPQTDRHTVEGIVSFGRKHECGMAHRHTVYTQVSRYLRWINESMAASGPDEVTPYCERPDPLDFGQWSVVSGEESTSSENSTDDEFPQNSTLEFACEEGFSMVGPSTFDCLSSGFWSGDAPFCEIECGYSMMRRTRPTRNLGAKWTIPGQYPWMVGLALAWNSEEQPRLFCGASLLDNVTVLTAANCLLYQDVLVQSVTLYFGKFFYLNVLDDSQVVTRKSTRIIPHYQYDSDTSDNNIALIKFSPPITYTRRIRTICLPTRSTSEKNLKQGEIGYALGWGITENYQLAQALLVSAVPVVSSAQCAESIDSRNRSVIFTDKMFCVGDPDRSVGPTVGDTGGPVTFDDESTNRTTVEGVHKYRFEPTKPDYSVLTKVSAYLDWIRDNMKP